MLQFFVGNSEAARCGSSCSPHPLEGIGMNRSERNFFYASVRVLESGIEVKFRMHAV